jgi:hypothetical protein
MKKRFMIVLWSFGIFYGCLFFVGLLYGMIHLHRISLMAIFLLVTHVYIANLSFRYLQEERGGPKVQFESEAPLSPESMDKLRSLWK